MDFFIVFEYFIDYLEQFNDDFDTIVSLEFVHGLCGNFH